MHCDIGFRTAFVATVGLSFRGVEAAPLLPLRYTKLPKRDSCDCVDDTSDGEHGRSEEKSMLDRFGNGCAPA